MKSIASKETQVVGQIKLKMSNYMSKYYFLMLKV